MYTITLLLHNYVRWLVLAALVWALVQAWWGWLRSREWTVHDQQAGLILTNLVTLQLILGLVLLVHPVGLARAAWNDVSVAMGVFDLRFFGLEHPLQVFVAIALIHLGYHRSKKGTTPQKKYR